MNTPAAAAVLSDADLLSRLQLLAAREREGSVELVAHLAELDARKIYLAEGYGSLFSYCTAALRFSEHAAYNRIEAARVARKFPVVLDLLADGSVNLTTVRLFPPHLTAENHREVLAQATARSKREIEALVAQLAPRPDVAASVRKLPATAVRPQSEPAARAAGPVEALVAGPEALTAGPETLAAGPEAVADAPEPAGEAARPALPGAPKHRPIVAPLAPERYRVQFTVGRKTQEKLRLAQDLLRREIPDGDPGAIFDRALTLLLEDVAKKKLAVTSKPRRAKRMASGSRHIPAAVKREVWLRDRGQCAFVARTGRRCAERAFLELHHVEPFAVGGEATATNISLRCRRHNVHEAELVFGRYERSGEMETSRTRSGTSSQRGYHERADAMRPSRSP